MKISRKVRNGVTIAILSLMPFIASDTSKKQTEQVLKKAENMRLINEYDISQLNLSTKEEKELQARVEEKLEAYTPKTKFALPYIGSDVKTELQGIDREGFTLKYRLNSDLPIQFRLGMGTKTKTKFNGNSSIEEINFDLSRKIFGANTLYQVNISQDNQPEYRFSLNFNF